VQFNNSSSKENSLYHHTLSLLGIDESDTTTLPVDPTFTRYANIAVKEISTKIWIYSNDWEYDDSNYTNLPQVTTNLVDGQKDYEIPDTTFDIYRVEVKDSGGDYRKLAKLDELEIPISEAEFLETDGMPRYYDLKYNSVFLYPSPSSSEVTLSAGLRLFINREPDAFTKTDTTKEPGFPENFHDLISYKVALAWSAPRGFPEATLISFGNVIKKKEAELEEYYSRRGNRKKGAKIIPKRFSRI